MARRGWGRTSAPKAYASIGDTHVDSAVSTINTLMLRTCAAMTEFPHTFNKTLEMLFEPSDIAKACAAKNIVVAPTTQEDYEIWPGCRLFLNYTDKSTLTIAEDRLRLQPGKVQPLLDFIRETEAIYLKFEEVKALLRWLNRNATPGAIRFYWPTVLKLCGDAPAFADLSEVPSRYNEPHGINARLQMLRDTATTMAAATMLSDTVTQRTVGSMWLQFDNREIKPVDGDDIMRYQTDILNINI